MAILVLKVAWISCSGNISTESSMDIVLVTQSLLVVLCSGNISTESSMDIVPVHNAIIFA